MGVAKAVIFGLALVAVALISNRSVAQTQVSVEMLRAACDYPNLPADYQEIGKNICYSHLHGFFDYHNAMTLIDKPATVFCLPPGGITIGTVRTFFMNEATLMNEGEKQATPAGFILLIALKKHFPCP